MSTQKDVVNDVKAESALEYAAAIKPKIKIIIKGNPEFRLIQQLERDHLA